MRGCAPCVAIQVQPRSVVIHMGIWSFLAIRSSPSKSFVVDCLAAANGNVDHLRCRAHQLLGVRQSDVVGCDGNIMFCALPNRQESGVVRDQKAPESKTPNLTNSRI